MAVTETMRPAIRLRDRFAHEECHSPYHLDAEVGHALRGMAMRSALDNATAEIALADAADFIDHRYAIHGTLSAIAWSLRHRVSFYDALYVALAVVLDAPLVTADARLTRTPLPCTVELVTA